jgi:predicted RNA-binding Zn-ribbon protein involved in translation (DUF1610 family)
VAQWRNKININGDRVKIYCRNCGYTYITTSKIARKQVIDI